MESLRTRIEEALDKVVAHRRAADFQHIAFHVASLSWPELRATTLSSDLGADALVPFQDGKAKMILACGVNGDLTKLKDDCARLCEARTKPDEVVFATTLSITEKNEQKWREEIRKEFDIGLRDVVQREWIISELEKPPNQWLCKQYLEIPLEEFQNLPAVLPRVRNAARKLLSAFKSEYEFDRHLLIDLSLKVLDATQTAIDLRLSELPGRLGSGDRCSITGVPGAGKTFSLLTLGGALIESDSLVPIFVPLRALGHGGYKLIDWIVSEPSFREQGITAAELSNAASAGKLLLLLNGWNEIGRDAWLATTGAISSFIGQMPACAVLVASRESLGQGFKFPARKFRIKPLTGDQVRTAIRQARIKDGERQADFILNSAPLSEIAAVPLFLRAIIREAELGHELPVGRQGMLRRMVERAVEEHLSDLEFGDVRRHALHYLADLSRDMTRNGKTAIPAAEAYQTIANTVRKLKSEALLGVEPAPPDILQQLLAGHLLISVSRNDIAFTHQLIQEHFAASKIVSALGETGTDQKIYLENLTDYQWEQPLLLALEDLAEQNKTAEIRAVLDWFRFLDFEGACRMVGIVGDFWSDVRDLFEPVIRHLASSKNVNAQWLAARCAAATGEPSFHDLVWTALDGHPNGTSDCFEGISSTFILRALGDEFSNKLLQVPEEEFRFRALAIVGRAPTAESLRLAETFATKDPAPSVRRLAFRQLFLSGRRGWLRPFFLDAKRGGCSLSMLRVLKASRQCTLSRFRKFARRYAESQTTTVERINTFSLWEQVDSLGASSMARREYDRLAQASPVSEQDIDRRLFCLRSGGRYDREWLGPRLVREALSPDVLPRLDVELLEVLSAAERTAIVRQLMPELARGGHTAMGMRPKVTKLDPVAAAESLLAAIVEVGTNLDEQEQQDFRYALHDVGREAIVLAASRTHFADLDRDAIRRLLRALSPISPGGDPVAVRILSEEILSTYRQQLLHWLSLLPSLDKEAGFDWAICATLIGEVGNPDDAQLLYKILLQDEERVRQEIDKRKEAIRAYSAGETATPPGPINHISYGNWHIAALTNIPGKRCMEIMVELLSHTSHIGVAAHTLATNAGAEYIDLSGSFQSRPRFDLIYDKRSNRKPLAEQASKYELAIKQAIDLRLGERPSNPSPVLSALCALARFSFPDFGSWILERLERYFHDAPIESVLETITLAGDLLPGRQILPFVRNTIASARSEPWSNHDKSYLVTKALISLFYSDSPGLAIELLKGDVAWFLKSYQFRLVLRMLVWERSPVVDAWLRELSNQELGSTDTQEVVLDCRVERALKRSDQAAVLEIATQLVEVTNSNPASMARQGITRLAAENESFRAQLFARAKIAQSISEAGGWLRFISEVGSEEGVRVALELAERFGEQLGVVSSIAPSSQEGTSLRFLGWFYVIGGTGFSRALYYVPDIMTKLHNFAASPDPTMGAAAERALLWIERQRILGGAATAGARTIPLLVNTQPDGVPWQLRLHHDHAINNS